MGDPPMNPEATALPPVFRCQKMQRGDRRGGGGAERSRGGSVQIVVLDGYTLNPGDLAWDALRALGACEIFAPPPPSDVTPRARIADAVLTNKVPPDRAAIDSLPALKYIGVLATGY